MRRIPFSYALASLLVLGLILWLAFGNFQRFQSAPPAADETDEAPFARVEVMEQRSTLYVPQQVIQGQLTAERETTLRANLAGYVTEKPISQGQRVTAGDTLLVLDNDALAERLAQARDERAVAEAEYAGAERLRQRELISQPELLRLRSALSASTAQVAQLEKQLDDSRPTAPFDGVLDRVQVELGDLLQPGEEWGRLIDDRRLTGIAWVSQQEVGELSVGLPVSARLLDGHTLSGELSFISSRADEATRSFYIEVTLDNPNRQHLAGASAEFTISLPPRHVHRFSPALLSLNAQAQLSVKYLDEQDRVTQGPVKLISADTESAYVSGLPDTVRLITLGAGLVSPGETVIPVAAERPPSRDAALDEEGDHAPAD